MAKSMYTNAVHSSIGVLPFFACYGWIPRMHPGLSKVVGVLNPTRQEFAKNQPELTQYLQDLIRQAQACMVDQYNHKQQDMEFKVEDLIYVNCQNWKAQTLSPKLNTRFTGPYPVLQWVGRWAYHMQLLANLQVHNVFHVSLLEQVKPSKLSGHAEQEAQPPIPEEDIDFKVKAVVGKHGAGASLQNKVLWKGYLKEAAVRAVCWISSILNSQ